MIDFAGFLREKVERYIELRRAPGYAFDKKAGTLRAFVRHIERDERTGDGSRHGPPARFVDVSDHDVGAGGRRSLCGLIMVQSRLTFNGIPDILLFCPTIAPITSESGTNRKLIRPLSLTHPYAGVTV